MERRAKLSIADDAPFASETNRVRRIFDKLAARYDRVIRIPERLLFEDGRQWACGNAKGDVLEIAIGTGRNLPFYSRDVRITGIELSPSMLAIARDRATSLGINADLREGDAQALPFPEHSFDTVVCTLGLCTIPDDRKAVSEAWRVLRLGGHLVLLEHVRSPLRIVRGIEALLAPITLRLEGDHLLRDPLDYLQSFGFELQHVHRSKLGIVQRVIAVK